MVRQNKMESLTFRVEEGINDIIRQAYWFEEPKLERQAWAIRALQCFRGITLEQSQSMLNGDMKFTPNPADNGKTMLFVPDDNEKFKNALANYKAKQEKEKMAKEAVARLSPFIPENDHGHFAEGKERDHQAWVAPNGNWYNVGWGDHQGFAFEALCVINQIPQEEKYTCSSLGKMDKAGDELVKLGWIMVERDIGFGVIMRGYQNMSEKQFNALYEVFEEQILFRGWTVRSLYEDKEEAKRQAVDD
jgi:hypothetical protein